jgi:hypothetical protein
MERHLSWLYIKDASERDDGRVSRTRAKRSRVSI